MAVALGYFTEFGKPAFQHITAPICGGIYARVLVFCSACTMSSVRKFTFAISSPDEFFVKSVNRNNIVGQIIPYGDYLRLIKLNFLKSRHYSKSIADGSNSNTAILTTLEYCSDSEL